MKVKDILGALEEFAPLALQDGYDNAGLQIGLAEDAEATGALLCLDVTEEIVDEAVLRGCNLIVSHHPLLFRPVKSITSRDYVGRTIGKAIRQGITVYAAHTNLDSAYGGVNFKMAEKLGLVAPQWLAPKEAYLRGSSYVTAGEGIIATLPVALSQRDFMERVKEAFGLKSLRTNYASREKISRVALCGGSGAFLIPKAIEKGADVFITGEIGYHRFFGYESDILLLEIGHYESEQYTQEVLRDVILHKFPTLPVVLAKTKTNPINYL
ncbi:MAG: Nif3-like dinuclear metal center hexameric protein [Bacteroidaceae bacterium]|nr:Nif3-like dinuclear metal center hexameric protein [Bacteroidaceae bacterium]